jgi:hypothetical protein
MQRAHVVPDCHLHQPHLAGPEMDPTQDTGSDPGPLSGVPEEADATVVVNPACAGLACIVQQCSQLQEDGPASLVHQLVPQIACQLL